MEWTWLLRLAAALGLSGVLGFEREARNRPAGLRTHMLVGMGSTLFTLVSIEIGDADPARIAAQVVTGVGFLGAGVIFRQGTTVRGLTTAANLWVVAAIGVTAGIGKLAEAATATAAAFIVLAILRVLDRRFGHDASETLVTIRAEALGSLERVLGAVEDEGVPASAIELSTAGGPRIQMAVGADRLGRLRRAVAAIDGVTFESTPRHDGGDE